LKHYTFSSVGIAVCGSCIDARGIAETELADGAVRGNMEQLASWIEESDRVLVF
jgi:uncharacterized protein involved in oxidation of intracellular sulfur